MATKNDPQIQENVDRSEEKVQGSAGTDARNNNHKAEEVNSESDTIKNANAAGLGAMGRNDQMQTDPTSNHLGEGQDDTN